MDNKQTDMGKRLRALWADGRSFGKRLGLAAPVVLAACYTLLFYGPVELVAFAAGSLQYSYDQILWPLALVALAAAAVLLGLCLALRGRLFNYAVTGLFLLTLGGYCQAAFFNGNLGTLTGDPENWELMAPDMLLDLGFWLVLAAGLALLLYLDRKIWRKALIWASCALVFIQAVPLVGILLGAYDETVATPMDNCALTQEGMYDYAQGKNTFLFVLDRLDYDYIQAVRREDPEFFEPLEGFTEYTNAISTFGRTKPALANLVTGYHETAYREDTQAFYTDCWTHTGRDLLAELDSAGYSAWFYTQAGNLFADPDYALEHADNFTDGKGDLRVGEVVKKVWKLSAYRYVPTAMKPFFWADTNYYNADVFQETNLQVYQFDDAAYGPGFQTAQASLEGNSLKLYHLFGSHNPYNLTADGTYSAESTSVTEQTMGCFNILFRAFRQMRELGIYDDATILILGDHGSAVRDTTDLQKATRIGLFYKPAGSTGPLTQSAAPVSAQNIAPTIVKAAGLDWGPYGTALEEVAEDAHITRVYYKSQCPSGSYGENKVYRYAVTGDAARMENWELVETFDVAKGHNFY